MDKVRITMADITKHKIMENIIQGILTVAEAAKIIGLSYRQTLRIKKRYKQNGFKGILKKAKLSPPNIKITDAIKDFILEVRERLYWDFNIMHFRDKLEEVHSIALCHETVRQLLMKEGMHLPKKTKKKYRRRRRMPRTGLLIQMDTSIHQWLECIKDEWNLIAMLDDATGEVIIAFFVPSDSTFTNMRAIRQFIEKKGLFKALYVDKASHFTTTKKDGPHLASKYECDDTQIERALKELGITMINANSPQAKGRIERLFRTFQDRLIKEMRLAGIKNYDDANKFLTEKFLPYYNIKFAINPEDETKTEYSELPVNIILDHIFCTKHNRKVNNDNTIKIYGHTLQLPPSDKKLSLANHKVDVCISEDNTVRVLYQNDKVHEEKLSNQNITIKNKKNKEKILDMRLIGHKAPIDHPWKTNKKKVKKVVGLDYDYDYEYIEKVKNGDILKLE